MHKDEELSATILEASPVETETVDEVDVEETVEVVEEVIEA